MKIITLTCLLLLAVGSTAFTQIKKGQFLTGGSVYFESVKNENSINGDYGSTDYYISPDIGYFIVDKFAGGLRIDFASYNSKTSTLETHYRTTSVSPFLRYYLLPLPKKVNVFIDVSYIMNKTKWNSFSNEGHYEKTKGYNISGGPSIFLSDKIALEFTLGYKHTYSDNIGTTTSNTFRSGFGLQVHLGKIKHRSKA